MADRQMPVLAHFGELKRRMVHSVLFLVLTTGAAFAFHRQIMRFLLEPAENLNTFTGGVPIFTELTEFWGSVMKISILAGLAGAAPFFVYQAVRFVAPGLRSNERRWLYFLMPFTIISFAAGVAFGYYVLIPPAIKFLTSFGGDVATPLIRIGAYVNLVTLLLFWMGASFELPIVMFFLSKIGILTPRWIASKRRWAIVAAFIVGAAITPTFDPVNQTIVAGPVIVLYEIGYWLSRFGARKRSPRPADAISERA